MSDLKTIRGMPDLYGEDIEAISMVEEICLKTFKSFNYKEFRTPLLENSALFLRSIGITSDIVQKEMYEFKDKKGERLCMRPEGTAGLVRALITNGLDDEEIKKFFYIGPMFRYERPQKGRKRQFFQAGVELIGDNSIDSDIEIILLAKKILDELNIKYNFQVNYLGSVAEINKYNAYLEEFMQNKGVTSGKQKLLAETVQMIDRTEGEIRITEENITAIKEGRMVNEEARSKGDFLAFPGGKDRFQKLSTRIEELYKERAYLSDKKNQLIQEASAIRALDSKLEESKKLLEEARTLDTFLSKEKKQEFESIKAKLDELEIDYSVNSRLVRGLDYYNGLVFEFLCDDLGSQNAVLAGGRYDSLIKNLGGRDLPATGFALGIDRIAEIVKAKSIEKDLFIGCVDKESRTYAQALGYKIRENNSSLVVENYLGNANVSKQLKKANSQGFKFAIIVGQDEIKAEKVKLKYLKNDKKDVECTIDELGEFLND
jgi:histidyl-tRNA synthetase